MEHVRDDRQARTAYALLVLTMALWAGNHIAGKWANGHIPPMTLAFLRWLGAAVLIWPFARTSITRDWPEIVQHWRIVLLLGLLGSGCYNTLQYIALTETSVTSASILNSWAPLLIAAAGAIFFGERLALRQLAGLALSLLGVLTIVLRGEFRHLSSLTFNHGDLVMLAATIIWAAYTTLLRLRPAISTMSFAALTYAIAALLNFPLAAFEFANGQRMVVSTDAIAVVAYTAVLASLLAYFLYARAVEVLGATRTGALIHLIPLFASAMAVAMLGETPAPYHAAGFTAILLGVALASAPFVKPASTDRR